MSLIPDEVKTTLGDILTTYADFERIRMETKLAKAKAQAQSWELADRQSDPQAKTDTVSVPTKTSVPTWALVGLGLLGAWALYSAVK